MKDILQIHENDNIALALRNLSKGEQFVVNGSELELKEDIDRGHKLAIQPLQKGIRPFLKVSPIGSISMQVNCWKRINRLKWYCAILLTISFKWPMANL